MLKIVQPRTSRQVVEYSIEFTDAEGSGFSFPTDLSGKIIYDADPKVAQAQRENYEFALAHRELYTEQYNEFATRRYTVVDNAVGLCSCKSKVELYDQYLGACQCPKCGRWYNLYGQELLDPQYWEDDEDAY